MRRGDASARDLADLALARIAALDPQLNAFGAVHADRALTAADEADRRRAAGEDGAAARGADRRQGRDRHRRPPHEPGDRRVHRPRGGRRGGRPPPARRRRGDRRQDHDARAGALAVHGIGHLGRHPQPVGHGPDARRVQRRIRRRGRRRDRAGRARRRRRGLDPHPRRLHGPVRPQAAARPRAPRTARPGRQPLDRLRRAHALRARLRDHARRAHRVAGHVRPPRPRAEQAPLRVAVSEAFPPGVLGASRPTSRDALQGTADVLRGLGHTVVERDVDFGPRDTAIILGLLFRGVRDIVAETSARGGSSVAAARSPGRARSSPTGCASGCSRPNGASPPVSGRSSTSTTSCSRRSCRSPPRAPGSWRAAARP